MRKHLSPEVRARLLRDRAAIDELLRPDVELPASAVPWSSSPMALATPGCGPSQSIPTNLSRS